MAFTFSSTSGSSGETTIIVSATPNLQTSSIVEYYTLSNTSGHSVSMPVTQKANQPVEKYIQISPSEFNIGPNQQNSTIQVSSNDRWIIRSNGWIGLSGKYDKGNTDVEVEEKPNELSGNGNTIVGIYFKENTGLTRTGYISGHCLSSGATAVTASTTVVQSGSSTKPYISVYPNYLDNVPSSGIQSSITVSSNTSWSASTLDKWVTIGTTAGTGNGTVAFTADTNTDGYSRSGGIKVVNERDGVYDYFTFKQTPNEKQYIFIEPDAFKVPSTGSTGNEIRVKANCEYDITADARWISLDATSGSGNTVVTFSTDENVSKYGETGNIIFSNSAVSTYAVVERESVEKYLSANTSSIIGDLTENTSTIVYVSSNVDWVVSVDNGGLSTRWLTASPSSGSGNGTIGITIKSGSTPMSGSVTLYNTSLGLRWTIETIRLSGKTIKYKTNNRQVFSDCPNKFGDANVISNTYNYDEGGTIVFDKNVTEIPASAFRVEGYSGYQLTDIELPDSVTTIGEYAFYNARYLSGFSMPEMVTYIGTRAFAACAKLPQFEPLEKLTYIGDGAFSGCTSMDSVTIPEGVTYIGPSAFHHCTNTSFIYNAINAVFSGSPGYPFSLASGSLVFGNKVKHISNELFRDARITGSLVLPSSLESIGDYAFVPWEYTPGCFSGDLTIPQGVSIGQYAFSGQQGFDGTLTLRDGVTYYATSFRNCPNFEHIIGKGQGDAIITNNGILILGCKNTIIPSNCTQLYNYAFLNCTGLSSITIPSSVKNIGTGCFSGCTNLTSVTFEGNGDYSGDTFINASGFTNCSSLNEIYTYFDTFPPIGERTFYNLSSRGVLHCKSGATNVWYIPYWTTVYDL